MPSSSYFSLPLRSSKASGLEGNPKKRKRGDEEVNDERDVEFSTPFDSSSHERGKLAADESASRTQGSATKVPAENASLSMVSGDAHQYRIAGQPFDQPLPEDNFPHTPLCSTSEPPETGLHTETRDVRTEIASLNPPLYVPNKFGISSTKNPTSTGENGLRRQHFGVLITLLNRLMCEGDFARASRAFGLLLRSHGVGGADVDIRKQGYWGIGAEILFRRDVPVAGRKKAQVSQNVDEDSYDRVDDAPNIAFNKEGFAKAKDYYERLILQYPYRKTAPHAISALDFYPAMFGLWIYATQEEYKIARKALEEESEESEELEKEAKGEEDEDEKEVLSRLRGVEHEKHQYEQREEIRRQEMQQAEEIAARLDDVLLSPPYSDSLQLRQLRTMLSQWVDNLAIPEAPLVHGSEDEQERSTRGWSTEPDERVSAKGGEVSAGSSE
ncbi:MAG: hypothetical protein M1812_006323 [Candelaria pacifica]|nr:MAG: hypothetical protein M1812_006323 [Candelaria pacifica]